MTIEGGTTRLHRLDSQTRRTAALISWIIAHRRLATWERERSFKSARLEVTQSTDSDNDDHYRLKVTDDGPGVPEEEMK